MGGNAREPGRTSASRLLSVLDAFRGANRPLTLATVARASGLAPATAHRLLAELVAWGGLRRTSDGRFVVGVRLYEIGAQAPQSQSLAALALPVMEDLYEATHENLHLGVLEGISVVVVQKISGRRAVLTPARSGGRLAAHATGNGKALLAFSPPEVTELVIAAGLRRRAPRTIVDPDELRADLERTRDRGYALAREENSRGTMSIAAPVLGEDGAVHAALSLVIRSSLASDLNRYIPAVLTAARALARQVTVAHGHWDDRAAAI